MLVATNNSIAVAEPRELMGAQMPETTVKDKLGRTIARCAGFFAQKFIHSARPADAATSAILFQRAIKAPDNVALDVLKRERAEAIEQERIGLKTMVASVVEKIKSGDRTPLKYEEMVPMLEENTQAFDCAEFGANAQQDEFWNTP